MPEPQQPELARSRKGSTSDRSAKSKLSSEGTPADHGPVGPIPDANQPGHRPEVEQDKPAGPPPRPRARRSDNGPGVDAGTRAVVGPTRLPFRFRPLLAPAAAAFGVTPWTAHVVVDDEELAVRFGPWSVRTPRSNVAGVERSGPFSAIKVAGGPHLSFADGGATFATSTDGGVCIRFHRPVHALLPVGPIKHPALTVTVTEPERLVELLRPD